MMRCGRDEWEMRDVCRVVHVSPRIFSFIVVNLLVSVVKTEGLGLLTISTGIDFQYESLERFCGKVITKL